LIDDGWPIFYSHKRVGKGGKTFLMHKFRSMYKNAPPLEPKIVRLSDGSIRYDWPEKDEDDPRITRVGRLLRKTSLDELPQIWNILTGEMSLIGPRPSSWTLDQHTLHQTARLTIKPGLTGLWQVSARDNKNFDERLLWDLKYVEKMGLWLDIQILLRTVGAVLRRSGV
jgi:lipopolysaccharide/colanic/teichoic acid biosynthesis glycosyltransferase